MTNFFKRLAAVPVIIFIFVLMSIGLLSIFVIDTVCIWLFNGYGSRELEDLYGEILDGHSDRIIAVQKWCD